jgi:glucan biosynthesis protein C
MSAMSMETTVRGESVRLHYLDWLHVIAILGVFVFHVLCVFNDIDFHIKNAEQSGAITIVNGFFFPWGMPLFFLIAGAGSWFSLQRRTAGQYARERFNRLFIPFVVGSILLSPIQLYFEWRHKVHTEVVQGSFAEFLKALAWGPNPRFFGVVGYHLWFLGFLFCFSLLTLPLFRWLMGKSGQGIVSRIARLSEHRGGILLFTLPLALVRLSLHPFFPHEHNWADFFFLLCFFVLGYLLYADERLMLALQRDWPIMFTVGIVSFLGAVAIPLSTGELDIEAAPRTLLDFVWWGLITVCSWCWTAFMLFVGMRFLNFSNKWLRYAQEAILPFFVVHQPVIIVVAYFVVQWNATILIKILAVVIGSFVVSIGLYQLIIGRVSALRAMFGMKSRRPTVQVSTLDL